jgi:hypothetical protein
LAYKPKPKIAVQHGKILRPEAKRLGSIEWGRSKQGRQLSGAFLWGGIVQKTIKAELYVPKVLGTIVTGAIQAGAKHERTVQMYK